MFTFLTHFFLIIYYFFFFQVDYIPFLNIFGLFKFNFLYSHGFALGSEVAIGLRAWHGDKVHCHFRFVPNSARIMDALAFMIYPRNGPFWLNSSSIIAPSSVEALSLSAIVWPSNYGDLGDIMSWYAIFLNNTQVTMAYSRLVSFITIMMRGSALHSVGSNTGILYRWPVYRYRHPVFTWYLYW